MSKNLQKLINLTYKNFNIKKFELDVDVNNLPAIKCYQKLNFQIVKTLKDKFGKYYKMTLKITYN